MVKTKFHIMHIIQTASMIVPLRTMEQMAVAKLIPSIAEMQMSKSLMFVSMILLFCLVTSGGIEPPFEV